ncbi:DNA repair protein RecO [Candidatus Nomurabacteria bacterium]|nr:DNA repair protein RecO [Candidatus Nomurabacteria bacterium]
MHHIYHTEGIILGSKNYGEAGKCYYIFTRDLGMIFASAQGVRKMSSKLRYVLQDFSYIKLDLVRGKDFWRLTSASKTNALENLSRNPDTFAIIFNIARLLKRLLAGEEKNDILFTDLISGFSVLEKAENKEEIKNIESVMVLRILNNLGYVGAGDDFGKFTKSPFEEDLIFEMGKNRLKILNEINRALKETHL